MGLGNFENAFNGINSSAGLEKDRKAWKREIGASGAMTIEDLDSFNGVPQDSGIKYSGILNGMNIAATSKLNGDKQEFLVEIVGKDQEGKNVHQELSGETAARVFNRLNTVVSRRDELNKEASFTAQELHEKETLTNIFMGTAAEKLFVSTDQQKNA